MYCVTVSGDTYVNVHTHSVICKNSSRVSDMSRGDACMHANKLLQLCLTLCNSMGCSPSGFSVQGILQARILEWVAMPSSRLPT